MKKDPVLNFNIVENQERCIYREYDKGPYKPYVYRNMIIQYFIYVRNYGWTRYKGRVYNLNKQDQAEAFMDVLKREGFLIQVGDNYSVIDSDFVDFTNIPSFRLLFHLYALKGEPLSQRECRKIDKTVQADLMLKNK